MNVPDIKRNDTLYGLPSDVSYCTKCVISNQRPSSFPEARHTADRVTPTIQLDEQGVCSACRVNETKQQIDWAEREEKLVRLLDRYRRSDGGYDCLVPGSGGKDSCFAAHVLKYKYGMNPLTVTFPPILYTDIGRQNFERWIEVGGLDNVAFKPNGRVQKILTRLSIENLLHPFQTFILGQKNVAPRIAMDMGIPLVFYGESEAEYGNPVAETTTSLRDKSYFSSDSLDDLYLAGTPVRTLMEDYEITPADLSPYLPAKRESLDGKNINVHYLGYYIKWTPQEAYYYAAEHCGFQPSPVRTEGTYSKYNSLDDKIDGLHYFTTWIKFGIGRATYDASQEIRNGHLTREEGIQLVRRFDGEFPERYFEEVMDCIDMSPDRFLELCDQGRSPHLWQKQDGEWQLRHPIWEQL